MNQSRPTLFRIFLLAVGVITSVATPAVLLADVLVLEQGISSYTGTQDNSIFEEVTDNSSGGDGGLFVGFAATPGIRRALIRFDLGSTIPYGATIDSVELRFVMNRVAPDAVSDEPHALHRLTRTWGEGTVSGTGQGGQGAAADAGDATWDWSRFQQQMWTTPGGDFETTPSATLPIGLLTDGMGMPTDPPVFSSAGMIADVEAWLADPASNFGWILRGDETGFRNARRFGSAEASPGDRPRLTINFTPPPTGLRTPWVQYD